MTWLDLVVSVLLGSKLRVKVGRGDRSDRYRPAYALGAVQPHLEPSGPLQAQEGWTAVEIGYHGLDLGDNGERPELRSGAHTGGLLKRVLRICESASFCRVKCCIMSASRRVCRIDLLRIRSPFLPSEPPTFKTGRGSFNGPAPVAKGWAASGVLPPDAGSVSRQQPRMSLSPLPTALDLRRPPHTGRRLALSHPRLKGRGPASHYRICPRSNPALLALLIAPTRGLSPAPRDTFSFA